MLPPVHDLTVGIWRGGGGCGGREEGVEGRCREREEGVEGERRVWRVIDVQRHWQATETLLGDVHSPCGFSEQKGGNPGKVKLTQSHRSKVKAISTWECHKDNCDNKLSR